MPGAGIAESVIHELAPVSYFLTVHQLDKFIALYLFPTYTYPLLELTANSTG